jgi:SAM-dependent methyltransferase
LFKKIETKKIYKVNTMKLIWLSLWNYPFDPRIHTLGNRSELHAKIAPYFTRFIDKVVYGTDVRALETKTTLDFGCGTGISTSPIGLGIDTSPEMLQEAKRLFPEKIFDYGNAENYEPPFPIEIVTCMFLLHEVPREYREKILNNACRIANEKVVVIDICPTYRPSKMMLLGEPYIEDYLKHIETDLKDFEVKVLVEGHVYKWTWCRE